MDHNPELFKALRKLKEAVRSLQEQGVYEPKTIEAVLQLMEAYEQYEAEKYR